MKVEVTHKGVYAANKDGADEPVAVGTELTIKGDDIPTNLVGKVRVINPKSAKPKAQKAEGDDSGDGKSDDDSVVTPAGGPKAGSKASGTKPAKG